LDLGKDLCNLGRCHVEISCSGCRYSDDFDFNKRTTNISSFHCISDFDSFSCAPGYNGFHLSHGSHKCFGFPCIFGSLCFFDSGYSGNSHNFSGFHDFPYFYHYFSGYPGFSSSLRSHSCRDYYEHSHGSLGSLDHGDNYYTLFGSFSRG
jgi:hypothetical protein